jgi:Protein of unknown function (DUF3089)
VCIAADRSRRGRALLVLIGPAFAPSPANTDASGTVWLCRPGQASNPCLSDETTTVISATGATSVQYSAPAEDPKIDCFYVYPTVSGQLSLNANLDTDPAETAIALAQASRFSQHCRVFAPIYPQLTLAGLLVSLLGGTPTAAATTAYDSVLSAWQDYLANYNHGRGFVLIGHSQGAGLLIHLIRSQIDQNPVERKRLIAAYLMGGNVTVPIGGTVGGDFQNIPACQSATQIGCVVAYSSFLNPPTALSLFGAAKPSGLDAFTGTTGVSTAGQQVLCVNPSDLVGGDNALFQLYSPTTRFPGLLGLFEGPVPSEPTPWAAELDKYTGQCVYQNGFSYLRVTDVGPPNDVRPKITQPFLIGPLFGLHLDDINLQLGNLVTLMGDEAGAYLAQDR